MLAYLEIIEGPRKGQQCQLWEGVRFGRTVGEIRLPDPKVSSLHAQVELDERGGLVLVDRDSNNGLRVNGARVKRVAILRGVVFQVGSSKFRVDRITDETPSEQGIPLETRPWTEVLLEALELKKERPLGPQLSIEVFRPTLQFEITEGPQIDQKITIGYGPRQIGGDLLDLEIQESMSPPIAFEVKPSDGRALFKTSFPKLVQLNDNPTSEAVLKSGDTIRIGQTLLKVNYLL